jgi:LysR family transcriptional regulator, glycine cleavage system transcriptional activator
MSTDRLPSLDRLLIFDAAARQLSFTKAAGELFLTQSAVSRAVATLEGELGVPLFVRRHRALDLSDDGRRLAATVAAALVNLRATVALIRAPHGREVLTLTTTPGLASLWLIPRLGAFTAAHPGVDVRIDASHQLRSLTSDGFDIAIRYGKTSTLGGTPLFDEDVVPVCAPALLRRLALKQPADLHQHTLLQTGSVTGGGMPAEWTSWLAAVDVPGLEPAALLTFSTYDTAVAAAVAGQGVVLGRRPIIDRLLRRKALVAPLKGLWSMERGYALVVSAAARKRPAAMALHDWLLEQVRQPTGIAK